MTKLFILEKQSPISFPEPPLPLTSGVDAGQGNESGNEIEQSQFGQKELPVRQH